MTNPIYFETPHPIYFSGITFEDILEGVIFPFPAPIVAAVAPVFYYPPPAPSFVNLQPNPLKRALPPVQDAPPPKKFKFTHYSSTTFPPQTKHMCDSCETQNDKTWRKGPQNANGDLSTLCNACYRAYRKMIKEGQSQITPQAINEYRKEPICIKFLVKLKTSRKK